MGTCPGGVYDSIEFETWFGWDPMRLSVLGAKYVSNPDFGGILKGGTCTGEGGWFDIYWPNLSRSE